jgi:hypothetical protein
MIYCYSQVKIYPWNWKSPSAVVQIIILEFKSSCEPIVPSGSCKSPVFPDHNSYGGILVVALYTTVFKSVFVLISLGSFILLLPP